MTTWLGLPARLLLVLLLVVSPSFAVMLPSESLWTPGVSDGSDTGGGDDGSRVVHAPLVTPSTSALQARPAIASVQFRLLGNEVPSDPACWPSSPRSPPQR